jgi:hypothetical protein
MLREMQQNQPLNTYPNTGRSLWTPKKFTNTNPTCHVAFEPPLSGLT